MAEALDALKKGDLAEADIGLLATAGAVQAIPDLKKQFGTAKEKKDKLRIASALVRLGDKDPAWWDYLEERAEEAIDSDAPEVQQFDANGKTVAEDPSPKFLAWAKVHSLTPEEAEEKQVLDFTAVLFLGESGDRRAIPLLRQSLFSPEYLIQTAAALELAHLHDRGSIPLIIQACEQAPAEAAFAIARALLDFDTPEAQSAAKRFRPPQPLR